MVVKGKKYFVFSEIENLKWMNIGIENFWQLQLFIITVIYF